MNKSASLPKSLILQLHATRPLQTLCVRSKFLCLDDWEFLLKLRTRKEKHKYTKRQVRSPQENRPTPPLSCGATRATQPTYPAHQTWAGEGSKLNGCDTTANITTIQLVSWMVKLNGCDICSCATCGGLNEQGGCTYTIQRARRLAISSPHLSEAVRAILELNSWQPFLKRTLKLGCQGWWETCFIPKCVGEGALHHRCGLHASWQRLGCVDGVWMQSFADAPSANPLAPRGIQDVHSEIRPLSTCTFAGLRCSQRGARIAHAHNTRRIVQLELCRNDPHRCDLCKSHTLWVRRRMRIQAAGWPL